MYDEVRRIEDELREGRAISPGDGSKAERDQLDAMKTIVASPIQSVVNLDCGKFASQQLRAPLLTFARVQNYVARRFLNEDVEAPQPNPYANAFWQVGENWDSTAGSAPN